MYKINSISPNERIRDRFEMEYGSSIPKIVLYLVKMSMFL